MAEIKQGAAGRAPDEQPLVLRQLIGALEAGHKLLSMYGDEHPNSQAAMTELTEQFADFTKEFDRATCVFAQKAVIVNDGYYAATRDSVDIYERLRSRGVMAFTIVGTPTPEAVKEVLSFLNVDPKEIRVQGGPSSYLRRRGVSRIVFTEAIYSAGNDEGEDITELVKMSPEQEDRAIAAVIHWLTKQDEDQENDPNLIPVAQLLSDPDSAAKLIREAVTKLHASKRASQGETVSEAIHDLKTLASDDEESWDKATPQIRKAISKLPKDMRPSISGFSGDSDEADSDNATVQLRTANIDEAELVVHDLLEEEAASRGTGHFPAPATLDQFFGVKATGLLSSWKQELQPAAVLRSSGRTLHTLIEWENNASDHRRIAISMANLTCQALQMHDSQTALAFAEMLLTARVEADKLDWRRLNIRSAIEAMDIEPQVSLLKLSIESKAKGYTVAIGLLELIPSLSLRVMDMLGTPQLDVVKEEFYAAVIQVGQPALPEIRKALSLGSFSAGQSCLEILAGMARDWSVKEIASAMKTGDASFVVSALTMLPKVRLPIVTETCLQYLYHASQDVRCAALTALGELGEASVIPQLTRIGLRGSIFADSTREQIAAVEALGKMRDPEALKSLQKLAINKPLLGRSNYDMIRQTADRCLERSAAISSEGWRKAG